jgi:Tol biopolymer transport system component
MGLTAALAVSSAASAPVSYPGKNGKIAFAGPLSRIYPRLTLVNPDGSGLKYLTRGGEECASPRCGGRFPGWSPNGREIVFAKTYGAGEIYVMSSDGTHTRSLPNTHFGEGPAWSPNGRKIVFTKEGGIAVVSLDGGSARTLQRATNQHYDRLPEWSPDGSLIVFERDDFRPNRNDSQIFVMKPDGTRLRRLTSQGKNLDPSWSPNSQHIAFLLAQPPKAGRAQATTIITMRRDGGAKTRIAQIDPAWDAGLAWSPDGKQLAYVAQRGPGTDNPWIYTMNLDGTHIRAVTKGDGRLSWQAR